MRSLYAWLLMLLMLLVLLVLLVPDGGEDDWAVLLCCLY